MKDKTHKQMALAVDILFLLLLLTKGCVPVLYNAWRVWAKHPWCVYVKSFTSQGGSKTAMQLSDGLVQLEQLGCCSPQPLQMRSWGLLHPLLPLLWVRLPLLFVNMSTPKHWIQETEQINSTKCKTVKSGITKTHTNIQAHTNGWYTVDPKRYSVIILS